MFLSAPMIKADEVVVLLHGLARTEKSMRRMEKSLRASGYDVINLGYPSRKHKIEELSGIVRAEVLDKTAAYQEVHFVTHSMGGIILRYWQWKHPLDPLGRVVMLSPPNQGSEVVDKLADMKIFEWINGPAGKQLGTAADSFVNQLPAVDFELGVITGNRSWEPFFSRIIPGEDDGKVSVQNAKVEGMKEFRVVPAAHSFIMRNQEVIALVENFIRTGTFDGADAGQTDGGN